MEWIKYLALPFVIALVITPFVMWLAKDLHAYAEINERTIHKSKTMGRIGGVGVYVAFIISMAFFMKSDVQIRGLLIGSTIMFFGGLIDDFYTLSPKKKFAFQIIAAIVVIYFGKITLDKIFLPFNIVIDMGIVSFIVTFFWLTGITNAVNLIDGLDGLATGISMIIMLVIALISTIDGRFDIMKMSLILAGALGGFLVFNFHPAKIFLGDSGALFIGFMIATISLMGFKSSTFITLGLPILMCGVPIVDTLSAILRRTLSGHRIDEADRNHLHHVLMRRFGHRNTVLILYTITIFSGCVAYIYIVNKGLGLLLLFIEALVCEVFIEKTHMISASFHPLTSIYETVMKQLKGNKEDLS